MRVPAAGLRGQWFGRGEVFDRALQCFAPRDTECMILRTVALAMTAIGLFSGCLAEFFHL